MTDWIRQSCVPRRQDTAPKTEEEIAQALKALPGWKPADGAIVRVQDFKNYYETMAFVNAVAWIAHREDHHPDISFGYKQCRITLSTHSIGGVSDNDFICAAKINALL